MKNLWQYVVVNKNNKYDANELIEFVEEIDDLFPIKISSKVNIPEYINKLLEKGIIVIAKNNNKIIGVVTGYINDFERKEAYISMVGIKKEYQNKGIGKILVNIFSNIAFNSKFERIKLETHRDNSNAINFYKRNNFICVDENASIPENIVLIKELNKEVNVLLTSVGRRGYLVNYFKEALSGIGKVYVSNSSDISPAFNYADASVVTPIIYDEGYIEFLLDYCFKNGIKAIISLFDIDLPVLSRNKEKFEEFGIKIIVSDIETVMICNDKYKTYNFLKNNNFNVKKTYLSKSEALKDIARGIINYPLIIKPRWGMGSISVLQVDNEEELNILYNKTLKNIKDTYLKYEANEDIENSILIQEKIKGQEYGIDIINDLEGNYVNTIVKKKLAMRSGETDCAVVVENEEIEKLGAQISKLLRHVANLDVDLFIEDGKIYVLEMNARFGGGYPFSHKAGVDLPKAIINWVFNQSIEKSLVTPKKLNKYIHKDINIIELLKT